MTKTATRQAKQIEAILAKEWLAIQDVYCVVNEVDYAGQGNERSFEKLRADTRCIADHSAERHSKTAKALRALISDKPAGRSTKSIADQISANCFVVRLSISYLKKIANELGRAAIK